MSSSLSAGVSGLKAFQQMLDVAGNNIANVNTVAFKASKVNFSELISQTISNASQPTSSSGGTNPQQIGSGVGISSIAYNMTQGSIVETGNTFDFALDGEGYFVVSTGGQYYYTRAGAFTVDANNNLVDSATGYRVQRIDTTGEIDGFQAAGNSDITIPYNVALPASATTLIGLSGNLSSDAELDEAQAQKIASSLVYTVGSDEAGLTTPMDELDQFSGGSGTGGKLNLGSGESGTITITGYQPDGTSISSTFTVGTDGEATPECVTLGDFIDHLNTVLVGATASLADGKVTITDDVSGYSLTDINLSYAANTGSSSLTDPSYFEVLAVGGTEVQNTNITVYDSLGGAHSLNASFVRNDADNTWDVILTSVSGDIDSIAMDDRRISGITFSSNGAFESCTEVAKFAIQFSSDTTSAQEIELNLGTSGGFNGLTGFAGVSTAVASDQDGYASGTLSSISVGADGIIVGTFSNNVKKDIATMQIALFQNPSGLESVGGGYYRPSGNSGEAIATKAQVGGAASVVGSSLEESNADISTEFVNLIEAQNGYQANARTITVANEILQELTNLIR